MSFIIAIDGPAGSGKGTITKKVAKKIGFSTLDTGALYRCVTLEIIRKNVSLEDIDNIIEIAKNIDVKFVKSDKINLARIKSNKIDINANNKQIDNHANMDEDIELVFLNNEDVTKSIRSNEVNQLVSPVSAIKEVREELITIQRNIAKDTNIIMEGRDIGTSVFPNANLKIYLEADIKERANRRYKENLEKGIQTTYEEVLEILKNRDKIDMGRKVSPLKKADDAIIVDSTNMTIEEVVNKIVELYNKIKNKNT